VAAKTLIVNVYLVIDLGYSLLLNAGGMIAGSLSGSANVIAVAKGWLQHRNFMVERLSHVDALILLVLEISLGNGLLP